jgi:hypothetical protein
MRTLMAVALLVIAPPLGAQEVESDSAAPEAQGYAPGGPPSAAAPSVLGSANASALAPSIVLPRRSEAQLQQAMRVAEADLRRADARLVRADGGKDEIRARAQRYRAELHQIEKQRKESKADEKVLDARKRTAERELRWTRQLAALGDAELAAAREARRVAQAKHQALELELQLAQKRSAQAGSGGGEWSVVVRELERQTLDAQKAYWKLAHQLALSEEDLAAKRLDLYRSSLERK